MERPVGDKFRYKGCTFVVVEDATSAWKDGCGACVAHCHDCSAIGKAAGSCVNEFRKDGKSVHFEHFGVDFDPIHSRAAP